MINMESIIQTIITMSLTGSILAIALFVLKPLIKDRLSKSVQYYLWIIVIGALLIPVSKLAVVPDNSTSPLMSAPIQTAVTQSVTEFREGAERSYTLIPGTEPERPDPPEPTTSDMISAVVFYVYSVFKILYI